MTQEEALMTTPVMPARLARLPELACNLWWSWQPEARALFKALDEPLWRRTRHNPIRVLAEIDPERLERAAEDLEYAGRLRRVLAAFDAARAAGGWLPERHPDLAGRLVAYFSAEYGLHGSLPEYAGGLGVLAGDHAKEASDLGVPLVAIGFMYLHGYFHQHVRADGRQEEVYERIDRADAPLEPACTEPGRQCVIPIPLPGRTLEVAVWRVDAGRTRLYLMDTDLEANAPWDRELSARLYGGDREVRLSQELLLGIGGVRLLRALGIAPAIWHANEGHTAFMMVERVRELVAGGATFDEAVAQVRAATVFTTHTPVPAGNEVFAFGLIERYLGPYWPSLGLDRERFLALGAHEEAWGAGFNMTALALRLAGHCNAVSRRHGEVARRMWRGLWPDAPSDDAVPITAVTNGVHAPSWVATEMDALFRRYLGEDWAAHHDDPAPWARLAEIPDEALWEVRRGLKRTLLEFMRDRARANWIEGRGDPTRLAAAGLLLDPEALTIGFARRFATYKRATLLLRDLPRLTALLTDLRRPVQLVFAGKAHPADEPGKGLLEAVYRAAGDPVFGGRVAFVEDYDMYAARYLVQGVDLWLNTPRPPLEASGTSGQKAALNGVPSLSVLDGWWAEAYDGTNGWAVGEGAGGPGDEAARDAADAEALYRLLEREVVPLYYDRGPDGLPKGWLLMVRRTIQTCAPRFSARRMVKEYVERLYARAGTGRRE